MSGCTGLALGACGVAWTTDLWGRKRETRYGNQGKDGGKPIPKHPALAHVHSCKPEGSLVRKRPSPPAFCSQPHTKCIIRLTLGARLQVWDPGPTSQG